MKSQQHPSIVIVDAYTSGVLYPDEFHKRGYVCIHVQSAPDLDPSWLASFRSEDFIHNVIHQGRVDETIQKLTPFSPMAVIAGSECGVKLADTLSEQMGLKTNGTQLSETRRNKYLTHELLREKGATSAEQIKSNSIDDVIAWATQRDIWPVVIKPMNSAGSEGVRFCHSAEEIKRACHGIINKKNIMGDINAEVLAQEFLEGDEYIVDTVSCNSKHFVCAIFKYSKIKQNNCFVYDHETLLPARGETQDLLSLYAKQVLDVVKLRDGPAHLEIMLTTRGPCLVEVNARLDGDQTPALVEKCTGYGQVQLTADAYVNESLFAHHTKKPYELIKHGQLVHLISETEGTVTALHHIDDIKNLPSFFSLKLYAGVGDRVTKTVDMDTRPGLVKLVHEDPATVERDRETIFAWEREGIFIVS